MLTSYCTWCCSMGMAHVSKCFQSALLHFHRFWVRAAEVKEDLKKLTLSTVPPLQCLSQEPRASGSGTAQRNT